MIRFSSLFSSFAWNFHRELFANYSAVQMHLRITVKITLTRARSREIDRSSFLPHLICVSPHRLRTIIIFYLIWMVAISRIKCNRTHNTLVHFLSLAFDVVAGRLVCLSLCRLSLQLQIRAKVEIELININGQINVLTSTECVGTGKIVSQRTPLTTDDSV